MARSCSVSPGSSFLGPLALAVRPSRTSSFRKSARLLSSTTERLPRAISGKTSSSVQTTWASQEPRSCAAPWSSRSTSQKSMMQHSFGGSFSAGSKPIFVSKYAFFKKVFKIYKKIIFSRANFANFCQKIKNANILIFLANFEKFSGIRKISAKFAGFFAEFYRNLKSSKNA